MPEPLTFLEWLATQGARERALLLDQHTSIGGPRHRVEIASFGIDESLQGIGAPLGGVSWQGLRVPFAPVAPPGEGFLGITPYLFCAFYFKVGAGEQKRIRGLRTMNKIGVNLTARPGDPSIIEELFVREPTWRFKDGWVSFHLRELSPYMLNRLRLQTGAFDTNSLAFRMAKGPALLYEKIHFPAAHLGADGKPDYYVFLDGYVAPNLARPWGEPLGDLGLLDDSTMFPWDNGHAWRSCDIVVGSGQHTAVAGFIVVRQTNPQTRPVLPGVPTIPSGIPQEDQFILDYPGAIEWRVGMSAIVEDV